MKKIVSLISAISLAFTLCAGAFAQGFTDVPQDNWAYGYIQRAEEDGIVGGIGDGKFAPDAQVLYGEFIAMMTRAFYPQELAAEETAEGEMWYDVNIRVAEEKGLLTGFELAGHETEPISRYHMAYIIYNILSDKDAVQLTEEELLTALSSIGDRDSFPEGDYYSNALGTVYALGIITGIDQQGTFGGDATMTRAQAAAVYCRIFDLLLSKQDADVITVGNREYYLGMTVNQLTINAGQPDAVLEGTNGGQWYVYGTKSYEDFFIVSITNSTVTRICAVGRSFEYMGQSAGSLVHIENSYGGTMNDEFDGGRVYGVSLTMGSETYGYEDGQLLGEAQIVYYITNAFRVYNGLNSLQWSSIATTAALRHAEDMAVNDYFSHTSQDGTTFSQRLTDVGINWSAASENICYGYNTGVDAAAAWIASEGHRQNMLRDRVYMGMAFAYSPDTTIFGVSDYYS